jgi:hypothetical protein
MIGTHHALYPVGQMYPYGNTSGGASGFDNQLAQGAREYPREITTTVEFPLSQFIVSNESTPAKEAAPSTVDQPE